MPTPPFTVIADYDYESAEEEDLPFEEGQLITVESIEDEEWYYGSIIEKSGEVRSGIFPQSFVHVHTQQDPAPISRQASLPQETQQFEQPEPSEEFQPSQASIESPVDTHVKTQSIEPEHGQFQSVTQSVPVTSSDPVPAAPRETETLASSVLPVSQPPQIASSPPKAFSSSQPAPSSRAADTDSFGSFKSSETSKTSKPSEPSEPSETDSAEPKPTKKKNAFADRIAAFNNASQAPVTPFAAPKPTSFVKKPFVAAPSNSYIPQLPTYNPPSSYNHHVHDRPAAENIVHRDDPDSAEEDEKPIVSLRDRIRLLQQQQEEEKARMEALANKKKQKSKHKTQEASATSPTLSDGTGALEDPTSASLEPVTSGGSIPSPLQHRGSLDAALTGGSMESGHANVAETPTIPEGAQVQQSPILDHHHTPQIPEQPKERVAEQEHEGEEGDDNEEEEDEEEEEEDEEEAKRIALRNRMAKISGGMGMVGMMGGFGFPGGIPAASKPKKTKKKVEEEEEERPEMHQAPVPILPFADPSAIAGLNLGYPKAKPASKEADEDEAEKEAVEKHVDEEVSAPVHHESPVNVTAPLPVDSKSFDSTFEQTEEDSIPSISDHAAVSAQIPPSITAAAPAEHTLDLPTREPALTQQTPDPPIKEVPAPIQQIPAPTVRESAVPAQPTQDFPARETVDSTREIPAPPARTLAPLNTQSSVSKTVPVSVASQVPHSTDPDLGAVIDAYRNNSSDEEESDGAWGDEDDDDMGSNRKPVQQVAHASGPAIVAPVRAPSNHANDTQQPILPVVGKHEPEHIASHSQDVPIPGALPTSHASEQAQASHSDTTASPVASHAPELPHASPERTKSTKSKRESFAGHGAKKEGLVEDYDDVTEEAFGDDEQTESEDNRQVCDAVSSVPQIPIESDSSVSSLIPKVEEHSPSASRMPPPAPPLTTVDSFKSLDSVDSENTPTPVAARPPPPAPPAGAPEVSVTAPQVPSHKHEVDHPIPTRRLALENPVGYSSDDVAGYEADEDTDANRTPVQLPLTGMSSIPGLGHHGLGLSHGKPHSASHASRGPPPPPPAAASQPLATPAGTNTNTSANTDNLPKLPQTIDLSKETGPWWRTREGVPSLLLQRPDVLYEVDQVTLEKRGGRSVTVKDIYVLFDDYSQEVITAEYENRICGGQEEEEEEEEEFVNVFKRKIESPRPVNQRDLENYARLYNAAVLDVARQSSSSQQQAGLNGRSDGFVSFVLSQAEQLIQRSQSTSAPSSVERMLKPVGSTFGASVYLNRGRSHSVRQYDHIFGGDIVTFKNAVFVAGPNGQSLENGASSTFSGVVAEYDVGTTTMLVYVGGSEEKQKFVLGQLDSGSVEVFRVVGRKHVKW